MKPFLLTLLIFCSGLLRAQDNPLLLPVDLLTGRVQPSLVTSPQPAEVRKARVKSITVQRIEEKPGKRDTIHCYKEVFSPGGHKIPYHRAHRDFDGFNSIQDNPDGTMASLRWKSEEQAGCYTGGMVFWHNNNYKEYTYRKGRLTVMREFCTRDTVPRERIGPKAGHFTVYTYDKNRPTAETRYAYNPLKPEDTLEDKIIVYRYNKDGQLLHHFAYDARYSRPRPAMDSQIGTTPDDFTAILLRQSYHWNESGLRPAPPPTPDLSEEEEEARDKAKDWRDSVDAALSDFYLEDRKNDFETYTGYEYGPSGLQTGMVRFVQDELSRRDTFTYDKDRRLIRWESWHLDYDLGTEAWEAGARALPLHWTWHFTYDRKGKIVSCRLERYWSPEPTFTDRSYHFRVEEESTYWLEYDGKGRAIRVQQEAREHHYDFNPDFIPPLTTDTTTYLVQYER